MDFLVTVKNVYGNQNVYPACDTSRKFADLLNTKTLTPRSLNIIKSLGYNIRTVLATDAYVVFADKLNGGVQWKNVK
jgi:hypothetical protein